MDRLFRFYVCFLNIFRLSVEKKSNIYDKLNVYSAARALAGCNLLVGKCRQSSFIAEYGAEYSASSPERRAICR